MAIRSICDSCGMTLDEKASFCPTCGGKMRIEEISDIQGGSAEPGQENVNAAPEPPFIDSGSNSAFDAAMNNGGFSNGSGNIPPVPPADIPPYNNNNGGGMGSSPEPYSAPYNYQPQMNQPNDNKDNLALAGMILGIISIVCCCGSLPVAIVGIILSIIGLKSVNRKGMAIAGIICSALSIAASIVMVIAMLTSEDFQQAFQEGFEQGMSEAYEEYDDDDDFDEYEYKYDWD
ncbi:MAG: hypothetical protein ACI4JN_05200 [Ruminococcus sp.]